MKAPDFVIIDHNRPGWSVVGLVVVAVPVVPVALDEQARPVREVPIQLGPGDLFIALVDGMSGLHGPRKIHESFGMGVTGGKPHRISDLDGVLGPKTSQPIAAAPISGAGLIVGVRERLETPGLVVTGEEHRALRAGRTGGDAAQVETAIGVGSRLELRLRLISEIAGDDIDDASHRARAVEQALAALQQLDAFDHVGGYGVERRGGVVEAVGNPDPIHQVQHLAAPRALQGVDVVGEGTRLRGQAEPGNGVLQRLADVDEPAFAQGLAIERLDTHAIATQGLGQGLFEAPGDHQFADLGDGRRRCAGQPQSQRHADQPNSAIASCHPRPPE